MKEEKRDVPACSLASHVVLIVAPSLLCLPLTFYSSLPPRLEYMAPRCLFASLSFSIFPTSVAPLYVQSSSMPLWSPYPKLQNILHAFCRRKKAAKGS